MNVSKYQIPYVTPLEPNRFTQLVLQRLLAAARISLLKKNKKKGFAPNEPSANDMDTWLALSLFRLNYKTVDI